MLNLVLLYAFNRRTAKIRRRREVADSHLQRMGDEASDFHKPTILPDVQAIHLTSLDALGSVAATFTNSTMMLL